MESETRISKINRFTTIPVLLDMLIRKQLVLLNPASWDDKNDSAIMEEYRKRKKVEKVFALCCAIGGETIHHWRTFADGMSGCCVEFYPGPLIELLKSKPGIRLGPVEYKKITDINPGTIEVDSIPFTKRWPYRCEREFRIIWEGSTDKPQIEIAFDLAMIKRITVSQRMPEPIYDTIRDHLKDACSNPDQKINRSTLYQNDIWIRKFRGSAV